MSKDKMHAGHRERMKQLFTKNGMDGFSDIEKLEFMLYFSVPFKDTNPIAHALLDEFNTLNNVINSSRERLLSVNGVGENTAIFFNMLNQLISFYYENRQNFSTISGTTDAKNFCESLFIAKQVEHLYAIFLGTSNEIISYSLLGIGDERSVSTSTKKIIGECYNNKASRIIICHNHPHGTCTPSDNDIAFTNRLLYSLNSSDMELLDHIVVASDGTFSMAESGQLREMTQTLIRTNPFFQITLETTSSEYRIDNPFKL